MHSSSAVGAVSFAAVGAFLGSAAADIIPAESPLLNSTNPCQSEPLEDYNLSFHVGAIFIVMSVSGIGTSASLFLGSKRDRPIVNGILQILKMFGIGVIASTAWIHLLPEAFDMFGNPCLSGHWVEYGTAYVGLFAMISSFLVQLIGMASTTHTHDSQPHNNAEELSQGNIEIMFPTDVPTSNRNTKGIEIAELAQTVILECGILVHSLVIGLTLGVTPDSSFSTLLLAIAFHQLFEGIALGVLLSATNLKWIVKFSLAILYPLTTPTGIALGIGIRNSFNENSQEAIVTQGILYSLSAGILIYNSYCELISNEINRNQKFTSYSKTFKASCLLSMYLGASALSIIGIWT